MTFKYLSCSKQRILLCRLSMASRCKSSKTSWLVACVCKIKVYWTMCQRIEKLFINTSHKWFQFTSVKHSLYWSCVSSIQIISWRMVSSLSRSCKDTWNAFIVRSPFRSKSRETHVWCSSCHFVNCALQLQILQIIRSMLLIQTTHYTLVHDLLSLCK